MRKHLINAKLLQHSVAPSYFIEGMLYNVPDVLFGGTYQETVIKALNWLNQCNTSKLLCVNERHPLIATNSPVSWNDADFKTFHTAIISLWKNWK
jgi:hypothetical protein